MATIRLNEKTLADLATPADQPQAYYWDTELVGLGVVVGRTGAKTFVARAWINGKGGTSIWDEPELKKFQRGGSNVIDFSQLPNGR